jgi:hypothetical protein
LRSSILEPRSLEPVSVAEIWLILLIFIIELASDKNGTAVCEIDDVQQYVRKDNHWRPYY